MKSRALIGPSVCVFVAVGLALAPHAVSVAQSGSADYLADGDDILYLTIARGPYYGETALRDPFASPDENLPTLYSWGQFVPAARLARWLGLSVLDQAILWRAGGAAALAAALYVLFRSLFSQIARPDRWATVATLACLADGGLVAGRPGIHAFFLLRHMTDGTCPVNPNGIPQYRVVTPLTNLAFPLVLAVCLLPQNVCRQWAMVAGGLALAGCVWVYFFYWTAAVVAGAGLIGTWLVAARSHPEARAEWLARARSAAVIGTVGVALGAPQIVSNLDTTRRVELQPTLHRLERGHPIPANTPARTLYLRNVWMWGELGLGLGLVAGFKLGRVVPLLWFAVAGFALQCSAAVTGLEFENYHWGGYVGNPFAVITLAGALVLIGQRRGWQWVRGVVLVGWAVTAVGVAAAWRPYEAANAAETREAARLLAEFAPLRGELARLGPDDVLAGPAEARVALLFGRAGMVYQLPHSAHSSVQTDDVVHQRAALNAWVCGVPRDEFVRAAHDFRFQVGPVSRPEWEPDAVQAARLGWFDRLEAGGGEPLLGRYHPDALLLPVGHRPPRPAAAWTRVVATDRWELWRTRNGGAP